MSILLDPFPPVYADQPFPLAGPGSEWELADHHFYPEWNTATGFSDWAELRWITADLLGIDLQSTLSLKIAQMFADLGQGGHPIAWRLWHKPVFDVRVPDQICVPDWLPWIGTECIDLPYVGGEQIASAHAWSLQILYQGSPPAIALTGSLTLILLALGIITIVLLQASGSIDLGRVLPDDQTVKETIQSFTPAGVSSAITGILVVSIIFLGVAAYVFPQLTTSTQATARAGPLTTTVSAAGRPRAATQPRAATRRSS